MNVQADGSLNFAYIHDMPGPTEHQTTQRCVPFIKDVTLRTLAVLVVLFLMSGCGGSSGPTTHLAGTVTINGDAVPSDAEAALSFDPLGGGESVSVPITNGRYDSPTTPQGSVLVKFYISRRVGPSKTSERTGQKYQDIANLVPPEHAAGMSIEVSEDSVNQDFDL